MNEPDDAVIQTKMGDSEKMRLLRVFILSKLPPTVLLRAMVTVVVRL